MRITSFEAVNFLSFDHLSIDTLLPEFNVIVGPNGAGKTNFLRAIQMVTDVLATQAEGRSKRAKWENAGRLQGGHSGFSVSLGISLSEDREWQLLSTYFSSVLVAKTSPHRLVSNIEDLDERSRLFTEWIANQFIADKLHAQPAALMEHFVSVRIQLC
jgi:AAA15 family ATPase/GTPase